MYDDCDQSKCVFFPFRITSLSVMIAITQSTKHEDVSCGSICTFKWIFTKLLVIQGVYYRHGLKERLMIFFVDL